MEREESPISCLPDTIGFQRLFYKKVREKLAMWGREGELGPATASLVDHLPFELKSGGGNLVECKCTPILKGPRWKEMVEPSGEPCRVCGCKKTQGPEKRSPSKSLSDEGSELDFEETIGEVEGKISSIAEIMESIRKDKQMTEEDEISAPWDLPKTDFMESYLSNINDSKERMEQLEEKKQDRAYYSEKIHADANPETDEDISRDGRLIIESAIDKRALAFKYYQGFPAKVDPGIWVLSEFEEPLPDNYADLFPEESDEDSERVCFEAVPGIIQTKAQPIKGEKGQSDGKSGVLYQPYQDGQEEAVRYFSKAGVPTPAPAAVTSRELHMADRLIDSGSEGEDSGQDEDKVYSFWRASVKEDAGQIDNICFIEEGSIITPTEEESFMSWTDSTESSSGST